MSSNAAAANPLADAPPQPPFELIDGVLTIRTQTEAEFLAGFEEQFWVLVHSERQQLILDLGQTDGLGLTAYQMIALLLFDHDAGKQLTVRIPDTIQKFFTQSKLYRKVDVEVVRIMGRARVVEKEEDPPANESNEHITRLFKEMESADPSKAESLAAEARDTLQTITKKPGEGHSQDGGAADSAEESLDGPNIELEPRAGVGRLDDVRSGGTTALPTEEGRPFTIGRVPDNQMQIASPLISRRHSQVQRRGNIYYLTDLGSGNGTYVNGKRLDEQSPRALVDGDRIVLSVTRQFPQGAKVFVFHQDAE